MRNSAKWVLRSGAVAVFLFVVVTLGRGYWMSSTATNAEFSAYLVQNIVPLTVAFGLVALGVVVGLVWGVMSLATALGSGKRVRSGTRMATLMVIVAASIAASPGSGDITGNTPFHSATSAGLASISLPMIATASFESTAIAGKMSLPEMPMPQMGLDETCGGFFQWVRRLLGRGQDCGPKETGYCLDEGGNEFDWPGIHDDLCTEFYDGRG